MANTNNAHHLVFPQNDRLLNVLYIHARLHEMLADATTPLGGGASTAQQLRQKADQSFMELHRAAFAFKSLSLSLTKQAWRSWKDRSETYVALADHFQAQQEAVLAADALARALELVESTTSSSKSVVEPTEEQRQAKLSLYLVLARNYYQCNQMERAIRSMEAIFEMNNYHEEARTSLAEWFPAKWK